MPRRKQKIKAQFSSEAALCAAFIGALPNSWTAYPECGGYDLVLLGPSGFQIGVEAKLSMNAKLLSQLVDQPQWSADKPGPDFRAALVPFGASSTLFGIAEQLGLAVVQMHDDASHAAFLKGKRGDPGKFLPPLPIVNAAPTSLALSPQGSTKRALLWPEWCPAERLTLPDLPPDLIAGASAPRRMTAWKIKAIRLGVLLDRRGYINRHDFARLELSITYWIRENLIINVARNRWEATDAFPDFAHQFPDEWAHYQATIDKWAAPKSVGKWDWCWETGTGKPHSPANKAGEATGPTISVDDD